MKTGTEPAPDRTAAPRRHGLPLRSFQAMPHGPYSPVSQVLRAAFLERPNRFVIICRHPSLGQIKAFLPNPGRLWELLFPSVTLYLARNGPRTVQEATPLTQFTVVAVERDGEPIFLHTHWTNHAARWLLENRRIPGLEQAEVAGSEVKHGRSRFDFLMRQAGGEFFLEVKSCTLFGNGVAMFPDAVTDRGRRHLEELAVLGAENARPCVLLLVQTQKVDQFMPDYHTDLAFSQTFLTVRRKVRILPVAVRWDSQLRLSEEVRPLVIPWDHLGREVEDRGSYLLLMRLDEPCRIAVGGLGEVDFPAGHYVYIGSAMKNLTARITRHQRRRKTMHWHVDYLRHHASAVVPLPIRSSRRLECQLAATFGQLLRPMAAGFGCSDCSCDTHLLWQERDPLQDPNFHAILQRYRMARPE
ncbi:MAG: DNA/RNA nuclease SfsA [Thermoguttaceae bacterium]